MRPEDSLPGEELTLYRGAIVFSINPSTLTHTNIETENRIRFTDF